MKKALLKGMSIAALSLGLLVSPMAIAPKTDIAYAQTKIDSEYKTHGWYYTLEEMKKVYEKEYEEGERLDDYIKIKDGKYIGYAHEKTFEVSKRFVDGTLKQLERMLEKGYAEYIFRLDSFHSHLFIPDESFYGKYGPLYNIELIEAFTKDEQLGALYHNSEHLTFNDSKTGEIDPKAKGLFDKRSVLGWYDGRELEITYPKADDSEKIKEANSGSIPDGYHSVGAINFKATKNGEFVIRPDGKEIRVDISFNVDYYY